MKNTTITITNLKDEALIGAIKAIVTANGGNITITEDTPKTKTKAKAATTTKTTKTKAKTPEVVRVDRKGRQWLVEFGKGEFPQAEYDEKKKELIDAGQYNGNDPRAKVYKELGWIL